MADSPSLDGLLEKQKAMTALAETLIDEKDVDRIQSVAEELGRMGADLLAAAAALAEATPGGSLSGYAEVQLTAAQRQRVEAATGVQLESIRIPDPRGLATRTMPSTSPRLIEFYAMQEAERRKAGGQADAIVRGELERALAEIEEQGTPELRAQLDALRADPSFVGNLLEKKPPG